MAERRDIVMHRTQVCVGMVVALPDMVNTIGTATAAQVTDSSVITEDPLALRMPRRRQSDTTI